MHKAYGIVACEYDIYKYCLRFAKNNFFIPYLTQADLYLIHEPMGDYYGSWRAMQDMYKEGMIHAIGVCNMWPDRMLDLILNADAKRICIRSRRIRLTSRIRQMDAIKTLDRPNGNSFDNRNPKNVRTICSWKYR